MDACLHNYLAMKCRNVMQLKNYWSCLDYVICVKAVDTDFLFHLHFFVFGWEPRTPPQKPSGVSWCFCLLVVVGGRQLKAEIAVYFFTLFLLLFHFHSVSLLCVAPLPLSPLISPPLLNPLYLVSDRDLISHLQLVSLIAGKYEMRKLAETLHHRMFYNSRGADGPNNKRDDVSSSVDIKRPPETSVFTLCMFLHHPANITTATGICAVFHSSCNEHEEEARHSGDT